MSNVIPELDSAVSLNPRLFLKGFINAIRKRLFLFSKRTFDIIFSIIGCMLLLPLAIAIKIASILTGDRDPIFYTQKRIGRHGKTFKIYKFRSMVKEADAILEAKLASDPEFAQKYTKKMKLDHDPRITKVGQFIRKTSIDEVPQFINVLKGDMSIIGNRPYLPRERSRISHIATPDTFNAIIATKPGITGLWQVSGRSSTSFAKRIEIEASYSETQGFFTDIKIFFKTFATVIGRGGAK